MTQVLSRDVKPESDVFAVSALRCWCRDYEERLGELVGNLLSSRCLTASPNKRKRGGGNNSASKSTSTPSAERILGHLDRLRPGCRQFYKLEVMQKALQQAQVIIILFTHCYCLQKWL